MIKIVLLAAIVATALAAPTWDEYVAKHSLQFSSVEAGMRRAVYEANVAKIAAFAKMNDGAEYGVNEFAHLSSDEFRTQRMGLRGTDSHGCPTTTVMDAPANADSVDWRAKGAVTPVKNQGSCGSCWAFSTTGDIEGTHFLATGKLVSLSEQDLVDCDRAGEDQGCRGGLMTNAMQSVITAGGIEGESDYPYTGRDGTCTFSKTKVAVQISNYTCVPQDEEQIAAFVEKNGPVSIGINANTLQFYMGGIADPWDFLCSPSHLDHGVLIVGFGTENNKPYWIVKNSWGAGWGEKGYFRIIRGKNKCGVANAVAHSIA